jgi:hypothetical protein
MVVYTQDCTLNKERELPVKLGAGSIRAYAEFMKQLNKIKEIK